MNTKLLNQFVGISVVTLLSVGCVEPFDSHSKPVPGADEYFDFKTDQKTTLTIDYGFPMKDYVVLFEVYDQNPLTEDENQQIVKKPVEPIYRGATDGSGRFSADIQLPSYLTKVWLSSDYPGTLSPVELEIKGNTIAFDQQAYMAQIRKSSTRAVTANNFNYPDDWLSLGDWDMYGTPSYLTADRTLPAAGTLYDIKEIFDKATNASLKSRHPEFFAAGLSSNIQIVKPTKVYLVFINSTASWFNTVGYYTYPTGQEPQTIGDVKRILAFPSSSPFLRKSGEELTRGALVAGDRVQLKYWDGKQFQEEFPAGVSIGWWLEGMGFQTKDGNVSIKGSGRYSRFSSDHLNTDGERRTVALLDQKTQRIVAIGFEDNSDMRYNDATFYLEVDETGSIGGGGIPSLPDDSNGPSEEENYVKTDGFLMFEDLWPSRGDYDMNDVMIKYSCRVYKHILNNAVYKIVNEFTPYHSGGQLQSAFGFQLSNLTPEAVRSVTLEGETQSRYMEGQTLEPGQSHPTILLFDNVRTLIGKKFVVTATLNDVPESAVVPPYNPFICAASDMTRGREVHLAKNKPTDKVDPTLFGIGDDGSKPEQGLYYVFAKKDSQYSFALNISYLQNIPIPEEGVKIDASYPKFRSWVESGGKNNKDWYLYPSQK